MRASPSIEALFPAARRAILAALVMQPNREWYFRDLAKHLGVRPSSLTRELKKLTDAGILRRRAEGNRVYYQADPACPILPELRGMMLKTAGLIDVLRAALRAVRAEIDCAFVYGSMARGEELAESDVDLLIIGNTSRFALAKPIQQAARQLARPVNPTLYKRAEFAKEVAADDHFLQAVLAKEKVFVVGDADDLDRARKAQKRVAKEPTTRSEINELRALADRNLKDAALRGLSPDGRFSLAYGAARTLVTLAIRACGYRVKQLGGAHYNTFLALTAAMGPSWDTLAIYFDGCRQSRNDLSYGVARVVSDSDAEELLARAADFRGSIEAWLRANHPSLT